MSTPARHLVAIRSQGGEVPLFLVHSMAGELTWLPRLAGLLPDERPLFGFSAPGLNHPGPAYPRIEDMAAAYLEEVLVARPDGPLLLGGYSFGGLVAFEMARQAAARGREVGRLILLDSHAPGTPPLRALPRWVKNGTLLQVAANLMGRQWQASQLIGPGELSELSADGQLAAAASHLSAHSAAPYPAPLLQEYLGKGMAVMRAHVELMRQYQLGALSPEVPVTFLFSTLGFVSEENPLRLPRLLQRDPDPTPAWEAALPGEVTKVGVATEHFLMSLPPALTAVAEALRADLGVAAI